MAQGPGNTPGMNRFVQSDFYDADGQLVLTIGMSEFTVLAPDGTISEYKRGSSIQLVDGLAWNPSMTSQAKPILLTSCSTCRSPPISLFRRERATHGLLSVGNAHVCVDCGQVTCPRHGRAIRGNWRCLRCSRLHRSWRAVRPIFFAREEDE